MDAAKQTVHVVICEESWEDIDLKTGAVITITIIARYAWLSGKPLSNQNVVRRCVSPAAAALLFYLKIDDKMNVTI